MAITIVTKLEAFKKNMKKLITVSLIILLHCNVNLIASSFNLNHIRLQQQNAAQNRTERYQFQPNNQLLQNNSLQNRNLQKQHQQEQCDLESLHAQQIQQLRQKQMAQIATEQRLRLEKEHQILLGKKESLRKQYLQELATQAASSEDDIRKYPFSFQEYLKQQQSLQRKAAQDIPQQRAITKDDLRKITEQCILAELQREKDTALALSLGLTITKC